MGKKKCTLAQQDLSNLLWRR